MTTKQRAYLKSLAMTMDPVFQIGKNCVTPEVTAAVSEALEARELIKLKFTICIFSQHQMSVMNGIKCASHYSNFHVCSSIVHINILW